MDFSKVDEEFVSLKVFPMRMLRSDTKKNHDNRMASMLSTDENFGWDAITKWVE